MPPNVDKRRLLLDAALEAFEADGFEGASVDAIAASAGVSKRTLYVHFSSKDALFRAIIERLAEQIETAAPPAFDPAAPVRRQFVALGWTKGRLLASPDFMRMARVATLETLRAPEIAAPLQARLMDESGYAAWFAAAAAADRVRVSDPVRAATQFLAMIKAEAFWPRIFIASPLDEAAIGHAIEAAVDTMLAAHTP